MSVKDDIMGLTGQISHTERMERFRDDRLKENVKIGKKKKLNEDEDSTADFRAIEAEASLLDAFAKLGAQIMNLKYILNSPSPSMVMNADPDEQSEKLKKMVELKNKMDGLKIKLRALIKEKMEFLADLTDDILGSPKKAEEDDNEDEESEEEDEE